MQWRIGTAAGAGPPGRCRRVQSQILECLARVERERAARDADPALGRRVLGLKQYQQRRFSMTYPDLLASPRYGLAARFFLDELYGPHDFTGRDRQFARIVPSMVRLFPGEVVATVERLARLHALSEGLDTAMARAFVGEPWAPPAYVAAWRQVGQPEERRRQIAWTLEIGRALDRLTAKPLLRRSLSLMRGPAQLAGLGELQRFLEAGFDAFKGMRGASEFLHLIAAREERLMALLFAQPPAHGAAVVADDEVFGQLP